MNLDQLEITDELLAESKIAAYCCDQMLKTPEGKLEPFEPKKFPEKAIIITVPINDSNLEIYLDVDHNCWLSKYIFNDIIYKLSDDQMQQFFETDFYKKLTTKLSKHWPISDPTYQKMFNAVLTAKTSFDVDDDQIITEKNMPNKRIDLANQDLTGDGIRDYSGSGRRIIHFGDMNVKSNSGKYFCWPRPGKEFKWNTWKDWTKIKPFAKMSFIYNSRSYGISLSLFDEQFDNRGFRGYDLIWEPPLAWLTPEECQEVMELSIVKKFLKQCLKRVKPYLDLTPSEVYKRIDKPYRITLKEIEKTQHVIKHVLNTIFKKQQADNYCYD